MNAPDPQRLPRDVATGLPIPPRAQPGYYPRHRTLAQQSFWDDATRRTVLHRLNHRPSRRFFSPDELALLEVVCAHVLPQDDRLPEFRIPIAPWIDERLAQGQIPGYRFEGMPPDGEAYRLGLEAFERMARRGQGRGFRELAWAEQDALLKTVHDADPAPGAEEIWRRLPIHRFWVLLANDCAETYYAHPYAWDEIGYGGPAYPRGYLRLERGDPEPWEGSEKRYEWWPPLDAKSEPGERNVAAHPKLTYHGQGGSH